MEEEIVVSLALYYTEASQEYAVAIDTSNMKHHKEDRDRILLLMQYQDNTQYNNFETLLIQNNVNCVYTYGSVEKGKLMHIAKLLDQLNISLQIVKKSDFSNPDVEHDLSVLIGEDNLNLYPDILAQPHAMNAAGVLLSKLQLCSGVYTGQYAIQAYSMNNYMRLDSSALSTLNIFPLEHIKDKVSSIYGLLNQTVTAGMGERRLRCWLSQPLVSKQALNERLNIVQLLMEDNELRTELRNNCLRGIIDMDKACRRLENKVRFRLQDMYNMYQSVCKLDSIITCLQNTSHELKSTIETLFIQPLIELRDSFAPFVQMTESVIDQKALQLSPPEFMISPNYNETLSEIAAKRNEAYEEIYILYNTYKERYPEIDIKCEHNARFGYCFRAVSRFNNEVNAIPDVSVLQVLKNGIHFTIDGNDDLRTPSAEYEQYKNEYLSAQKEVITSVIEVAFSYIPLFHVFSTLISQIDVLAAFAEVSSNATIPYTRPEFLDIQKANFVHIEEGRHPLLEIQSSIQFIPNSYDLQCDHHGGKNVVIITGPNMGGKSTYMRQLGIIIIMAQIGCFVPATKAIFPPFTALFTRIGASDNQSRGVSTFMSEMIDMSNILNACKEEDPNANSLIIIDELGRGTSTYDGLGLSWGILEHIIKNIPQCYCLFTTHYYELTTIAKDYTNVKNIHVTALTRDNYIAMLYGIKEGPSDKSFGINVAQLCNFPSTIIKDAEKKVWELEAIAKANAYDKKCKEGTSQKRHSIEQITQCEKRVRMLLSQPTIKKEDVNALISEIDQL